MLTWHLECVSFAWHHLMLWNRLLLWFAILHFHLLMCGLLLSLQFQVAARLELVTMEAFTFSVLLLAVLASSVAGRPTPEAPPRTAADTPCDRADIGITQGQASGTGLTMWQVQITNTCIDSLCTISNVVVQCCGEFNSGTLVNPNTFKILNPGCKCRHMHCQQRWHHSKFWNRRIPVQWDGNAATERAICNSDMQLTDQGWSELPAPNYRSLHFASDSKLKNP